MENIKIKRLQKPGKNTDEKEGKGKRGKRRGSIH